MSYTFEGIQGSEDQNIPKDNKFIFEGVQEEEPSVWQTHKMPEENQFIRPLISALKKEKLEALRHIPASAMKQIEGLRDMLMLSPVGIAIEKLSEKLAPGAPEFSEMIRGPQEGLTEQEKRATQIAEDLLPLIMMRKAPKQLAEWESAKIAESLAKKRPKIPLPSPGKPPSGKPSRLSLSDLESKKGLGPDLWEMIKKRSQEVPPEISKSLESEYQAIRRTALPEEGALKKVISKEPYKGKITATETSYLIKNKMKSERKPFEKLYKIAEREFDTTNSIYPELAAKNDILIERLEQIPKRNAGEEKVYEYAKTIRNLIGGTDALIEVPAGKLVKQSNSISELANYDMPYIGSKGILRTISHDLNEAAINAVKSKGKNAQSLIEADKLYGRWADKYLNDEIEPLIVKHFKNPEKAFDKIVKNPESFRAVKEIINDNPRLLKRYTKEIIHDNLNKFYENPERIGSQLYQEKMQDMQNIIGKEETAKIDRFLKRYKQKHLPFEEGKNIREAIKTPEKFKKTQKLFEEKGQSEIFKKHVDQAISDMFREGRVSGKKLTGNELYKMMANRDNYEFLTAALSEDKVLELMNLAHAEGRKELTKEFVKRVGKDLLKTTFGGSFLRIILGYL